MKGSSLNPSAVFEINICCLFVPFLIIIFIHFDNNVLRVYLPHGLQVSPSQNILHLKAKTIPTVDDAFLREWPHLYNLHLQQVQDKLKGRSGERSDRPPPGTSPFTARR